MWYKPDFHCALVLRIFTPKVSVGFLLSVSIYRLLLTGKCQTVTMTTFEQLAKAIVLYCDFEQATSKNVGVAKANITLYDVSPIICYDRPVI